MFLVLKIESRNLKTLKKFLLYLKTLKINFIIKQKNNKTKKKLLSILKSPHVNKKAQEQFEYKTFSYLIKIKTFCIKKFIVFMKKTQVKLFSDLKFKTTFYLNKYSHKNNINTILDPDKFTIIKSKQKKNIKNYLKIYDIYGEFNLKNV